MNNAIKFLYSITLMFSSFILIAQPPSPPATPIDGGLGILLAGGAAYGLKKLKEARENK